MWHSFEDTISLFNRTTFHCWLWALQSQLCFGKLSLGEFDLLQKTLPFAISSRGRQQFLKSRFSLKFCFTTSTHFQQINRTEEWNKDWKMKPLQFYEFQRDSPRYEPWTYLWYMTKPVINLWGDNSEIPHIFVSSLENKTWSAHLVICKPSMFHHTSSNMLQCTINLTVSCLHYLD